MLPESGDDAQDEVEVRLPQRQANDGFSELVWLSIRDQFLHFFARGGGRIPKYAMLWLLTHFRFPQVSVSPLRAWKPAA